MINDKDAAGYGQGQRCGVYRKEVVIYKVIIVVRINRVKMNLISN